MMTPQDPQLHRALSAARRAQGISQSSLAQQIGCKQSAISMMERGQTSVLAWSKVEAAARLLNVSIEAGGAAPESPMVDPHPKSRYCPTFDCPSNTPYAVNGLLYALPRKTEMEAAKHCGYCGELLETHCPNCGDDAQHGACCTACGTAYIATPDTVPNGAEAWSQAHRNRLNELGIT